MKKSLLTATALSLALTASAFAADLPSRKAPAYIPPPPPPPLWTGFYGGLNAGYGWGTNSNVSTVSGGILDNPFVQLSALSAAFPGFINNGWIPGGTALANSGIAQVNQSGFVGGAQIGYNYQINTFVVGLEADIQGAGVRGSGGYTGAYTDSASSTVVPAAPFGPLTLTRTAAGSGSINAGVDWLGTVRGRVGYLFTPTLLIYATGGLAYGGVHSDSVHSAFGTATLAGGPAVTPPLPLSVGLPTTPGTGNLSDARVGWTIGGGLEWMFLSNWSLKAEALYYDLGHSYYNSSPIVGFSPLNIAGAGGVAGGILAGAPQIANVPLTRVNWQGVIARVGVNYHFNWGAPAPVLAKY